MQKSENVSIEKFFHLREKHNSDESNCTNIEEINMPDSVRRIGKDVIFGCEKLSDFAVPRGVICIVGYTFQY